MMIGSKVDYDISNLYIPKDSKEDIDYQKSFNATLTIIVRDKDGKVIRRHKQKSHSPTANFIGLMLPATWYNTTGKTFTLTSTSNSTYNYAPYGPNIMYGINYPNSNSNQQTYLINIMVGSGSNSNPYSAINLASPISNGSGTGQLLYMTPNIPTGITINDNQAYFITSQSFINQSGGTVNITEVGIVINLGIHDSANYQDFTASVLTWYDVLSSPISVGSGQSIVIYYTFSVNA